MTDQAEAVLKDAMLCLGRDYSRIQERLEATKGTSIHTFLVTFLEWHQDKRKSQLLWEMFHDIISINPLLVLGDLDSFVGNYLLDDSYFKIKWRKVDYAEDFSIQWLRNGNMKMKAADKDDLQAKPMVLRAKDDKGSQDVDLLLEAMRMFHAREELRVAAIEAEFGKDEDE